MPEGQKLADEGKDEHGEARQLIGRIKNTDDDDHLVDLVTQLEQAINHHVNEEESEMLPKAREALSAEQHDLVMTSKRPSRTNVTSPSRTTAHDVRRSWSRTGGQSARRHALPRPNARDRGVLYCRPRREAPAATEGSMDWFHGGLRRVPIRRKAGAARCRTRARCHRAHGVSDGARRRTAARQTYAVSVTGVAGPEPLDGVEPGRRLKRGGSRLHGHRIAQGERVAARTREGISRFAVG